MLMLLWAASSGPREIITGGSHAQTAVPTATASATQQPGGVRRSPQQHRTQRPARVLDLSWVGELVEALLLLGGGWLLWLGVRAFRDRLLAREHPTRIAAEFETQPDPEVVAQRVSSALAEQLNGLAAGTPRNAIVRCWVLLEDAARDLGVGPAAAETPTEFITRFLHRLDVDPRPAGQLAHLYHAARFSTHDLVEADRDTARRALVSLQADLAVISSGGAAVAADPADGTVR